jgi:hypothetical protein
VSAEQLDLRTPLTPGENAEAERAHILLGLADLLEYAGTLTDLRELTRFRYDIGRPLPSDWVPSRHRPGPS